MVQVATVVREQTQETTQPRAPVWLPPHLSVRTVARWLGVRRSTVYGYCRAGTWPGSYQHGARAWRVRTAALVEWWAALRGLDKESVRADLADSLPWIRRCLTTVTVGAIGSHPEHGSTVALSTPVPPRE